MSEPVAPLMDVDAFLAWSEEREGRFELHDGLVVAMAPERSRHLLAKGAVYRALGDAISRARLPCVAYPDGATVRVSQRSAFEPDALVRCGPPLPPAAIEIPDPVLVVEVLSPSSVGVDHGLKLQGYFTLPSVHHYLIVDADRRTMIHHKRGDGDALETRILGQGLLGLDPPGLELMVESLFGAE
jgi:Uma2 family endonuclease